MASKVVGAEGAKKYGKYDEWEVKSWADTLQAAAEIMSDKEKMKAVAACMEGKKRAIKTIEEMRAYANAQDE
jgi:hypothetical protein